MPKPAPLHETFLRVWIPTLVVAVFIITFVVQPFDIPSASMENTLLVG
ncbi:MAG: S26 family signal peptidase, partial [Terriglobales bacterium]